MAENETALHRVLGDERRAEIVDALRAAGSLDARELGRRVWLHPNTVRFHLAQLRDAGLVTSSPAANGKRGRPRIVYALDGDAAHDRTEEHRLLATILAGALGEVADGGARAESAGRAWGRYLVQGPPPFAPHGAERAREEVTALLARQGFQPETEDGGLVMHRCPFRELAETEPHIVCAAHRGLIAGALEELGGALELAELQIFPRPDVCIARLRRAR